MSITSKAILEGNIDPIELAQFLAASCGVTNVRVELTHKPSYLIVGFHQRPPAEQMALPERKREKIIRSMSVFLNGMCKEDYADVTSEPATLVTIGSGGQAEEILTSLCQHYGGWCAEYDANSYSRITRA